MQIWHIFLNLQNIICVFYKFCVRKRIIVFRILDLAVDGCIAAAISSGEEGVSHIGSTLVNTGLSYVETSGDTIPPIASTGIP